MPDLPPSRVGTPLDRLVVSVRAWDKIPSAPPQRTPRRGQLDRDRITLERAKGAVMFRYGVNSHVAFAMIARWSRTAEIPIMTLATALVAGSVENGDFSEDQPSLDEWLGSQFVEDD
jgi:hypothetical protein